MTATGTLFVATLLAAQDRDTTISELYVQGQRIELEEVTDRVAAAYRMLPLPEVEKIKDKAKDKFQHLSIQGSRKEELAVSTATSDLSAARNTIANLLRTNAAQELRVF